jgi:riboflavin kinase/FMN adenylyltransferase
MKRILGVDNIARDGGSVITVGTFDGLHLGHQAVVRYLVRRAEAQGGRSVVITFDPHPRDVIRGDSTPLLTTIEERARVLESLGVDRFLVIPFDKAFAALSARDFVETILVEKVGLQEIVIGYDHGFGRGREGDSTLLVDLGAVHGFSVDVIPVQVMEEHVISSTEIRRLLLDEGDVRQAASLLGRRYGFTGTVVEGDKRGRLLGYPTANLAPDHPNKVLPLRGVYAVRAEREASGARNGARNGAGYGGMLNIGFRPTFSGTERRVEVHLFDFDGDLYGEQLRIEFVERMREEQKFESIEALKEQLSSDERRSRAALKAG